MNLRRPSLMTFRTLCLCIAIAIAVPKTSSAEPPPTPPSAVRLTGFISATKSLSSTLRRVDRALGSRNSGSGRSRVVLIKIFLRENACWGSRAGSAAVLVGF